MSIEATFRVGDKVMAGDAASPEDFDVGEVMGVAGSDLRVAWEWSAVTTMAPVGILAPWDGEVEADVRAALMAEDGDQ